MHALSAPATFITGVPPEYTLVEHLYDQPSGIVPPSR